MSLTGLAAAAASILLALPSGLLPDATPALDPHCTWRLATAQLYAELVDRTDDRSVALRSLLAASDVDTSGFLPSTCTSGSVGAAGAGSAPGNPDASGSSGGDTGSTGATGSYTFDDEFNGSAVDTTTWAVLDRPGDSSNNEAECYKPGNVTEAGGYLQITSKVDTCTTGQKYSSGAVQWRSFTLKYGTVEIRAKQSGGHGSWPAQWLLGADCQTAFAGTDENAGGCNWPNPGSDEVDITEFKSQGTTVDWQNVVIGNSGFTTCKPTISDASQNWHTYTFTRSPSSITWGIDGTTTCVQREVVPQDPMFLIMNNAMGGQAGQVNDADYPQAMQIDYVRAFASTAPMASNDDSGAAGRAANGATTDATGLDGANRGRGQGGRGSGDGGGRN